MRHGMKLTSAYTALFTLLLYVAGSGTVAAVGTARNTRIPVMIVGVSHFVSRHDVHNSQLTDIMSPERQQQIQLVVQKLARFKPTKVMIEQPYGDEKIVHEYRQYLDGSFALGTNEVFQLGFRLAAQAKNTSVYPNDTTDTAKRFPFDSDKLAESARQHNETAILDAKNAHLTPLLGRQGAIEQHGTILELLRYLNSSHALDLSAASYMYDDRIGAGDDYAGAELVSYWYARNLHIFVNITHLVDAADDRVVVLIGAGHSEQLREYVRLSPDLELVDPESYLK